MSIPASDRNEYVVSSLGTETSPQGIIVKESLWFLQKIYKKKLILKNYGGSYFIFDSIIVENYQLTPALKNDLTIDNDRMWAWVVSPSGTLSLYEIEPYDISPPIITYSKVYIDTNINSISVFVKENDAVRIIALYLDGLCKSINYLNIRDTAPPVTSDITWSGTRLTEFSNSVSQDLSTFDLTYLDVASPPNVYLDSTTVEPPTNFSAVRVGTTNDVDLSWDSLVSADLYLIQRDISPSFTDPIEVITEFLTYTDTLPNAYGYYYRIRALNSGLLLQSTWSTTEYVAPIFHADFEGSPLSGAVGDTITFTDLSIPIGSVTSWDWDFGDGNTSALQNPMHSYSLSGTYDVTLTVYSDALSDSITKPSYITISPALVADFLADPSSGGANLIVNFTDQSLGSPISWYWDFGDGSPHSFVRNPVHVYFIAGVHSVTLTVSDGTYTVATSKDVTVNMVADFITDVVSGYADLTVNFTDTSWGTPTSWYWDFGDGSYSTEQNPAHTYTTPGHFTVSLTVSRDPGTGAYTDTIVQTDLLSVYTKAEFSGSPRIGYQNLLVQFVDESKGEPTSWYWDFGDESFSEEQNPSHEYKSPGEYTVTLTAASFFNSDIETKKKYIIVEGTATPDIAPEPDILLYTDGQVKVNKEKKGIRVVYLKNSSSY